MSLLNYQILPLFCYVCVVCDRQTLFWRNFWPPSRRVSTTLARTRKHEKLGQNPGRGPFQRSGILTTNLVPGDSPMNEKPSLGIPVSKFRILLKIRHILWSKNRPSRAILLPLPFSKESTPEVPTASVPPPTCVGDDCGGRNAIAFTCRRQSPLEVDPSWRSYLFEIFSGVNG